MSEFGLIGGRVDPTTTLHDLPAFIGLKLREELDHNPPDTNWRALIRQAEKEYPIRAYAREAMSSALGMGSSPTDKLLSEFSSRGMKVKELAEYLDKIKVDPYKFGLTEYENIEIIKQPPNEVEVYAGGVLSLEVVAKGLPYPRYQWYICHDNQDTFKDLPGRVENILKIENVSVSDAGVYACQIHNSKEPGKARLTDYIVVAVLPNPFPDPEPKVIIEEEGFRDIKRGMMSPDAILNPLINATLQGRLAGPVGRLITRQPLDVMVGMNEPFVVAVETQGVPPLTYQWYRDGLILPQHVTSKIEVRNAMKQDFGVYECVVKNQYITERSQKAFVRATVPLPVDQEIVMISNPKSCSVKFGGCAVFHCEAKCSEALCYQWFRDGKPLPGETRPELMFRNIQTRSVEGMYQCEIYVEKSRRLQHFTSGAMLTVEIAKCSDNIEYNPSDKVALLIGNFDYRSEERLNAPINDVQVLSEAFRSLDFKVVALLNLTKPEIESAVLEFCELLGENIYAVFYFCGHGFEESGLPFMVPTDAPHGYQAKHCVCAYDVLENIQSKSPPLICCILDICRKQNKIQGELVKWDHDKRTQRANTAFCYATSQGMNAFEDKRNGLLVKHLQPLLRKRIGVDTLFSQMKEEFGSVKKHSEVQMPEMRSNLVEIRRSLTDQISYTGQTEAFQLRTQRWMNAHKKPEKRVIHMTELNVVVELDFQSDISNILDVFCIVRNPGVTVDCIAYIINWPATVSMMGQINPVRKNPCTTKISLQDIQKLQGDLVVTVVLDYCLRDEPKRHKLTKYTANLELPLVARLRLWQERQGFAPQGKEPTESAEDT